TLRPAVARGDATAERGDRRRRRGGSPADVGPRAGRLAERRDHFHRIRRPARAPVRSTIGPCAERNSMMLEPLQSPGDESTPAVPGADPLIIDDLDRYSRLRLISWWRQERLREARVLVVGAGALGNEVLKNLALVGLGTIEVIDLDVVEPSNLSRSVLFRGEDGGRPKAEVGSIRAGELIRVIRITPMHGDEITDVAL